MMLRIFQNAEVLPALLENAGQVLQAAIRLSASPMAGETSPFGGQMP